MADGVAAQAGNPEVTLDASRPNTLVNDQIFTLRLITNKLENAYNGMDVEWDGKDNTTRFIDVQFPTTGNHFSLSLSLSFQFHSIYRFRLQWQRKWKRLW